MRYLITGNLGYIGPILSEFIKKTEPSSEITGYDMGYFLNYPVSAESLKPRSYVDYQVFGDVRDQEKLNKYISWADCVIHLAAISNDPMGIEFEKVTNQVNCESSILIAEQCIKQKKKSFVFASSCSVYGCGSDLPRKESDEVNPLTAYAKSKIGTENGILNINDLGKSIITSMRFSTACGYSPNLRLDLVLNDFVATAIHKSQIDILSDGSPWRPLIDVEDMARAIYWACHRDKGEQFEIINIGSPQWNYQIKDLAEAVKANLSKSVTLNINKDAVPDKRSYRVDFLKFYEMADNRYTPKIDLRQSVSKMVKNLMHYPDRLSLSGRKHLIRLNILQNLKNKKYLNENLEWII